MPLKESCVVFIIWEHIIVVFFFDALFGLTWRMFDYKPVTSSLYDYLVFDL
jgi:hypothetical protein